MLSLRHDHQMADLSPRGCHQHYGLNISARTGDIHFVKLHHQKSNDWTCCNDRIDLDQWTAPWQRSQKQLNQLVPKHTNKLFIYVYTLRVKKTGPFLFEHNFGKYCPILIILSLLQTEINYDNMSNKNLQPHLRSASALPCKMNKNVNVAGMIS